MVHGLKPEDFAEILKILKERYQHGNGTLHVSDQMPFRVLIGAVLSHRTKDEKTDEAYHRLFSKFKDGHELANADVREIAHLIKPVGFYRQKAKRIKKIAQIIYGEKGGHVPDDREELMKLPGVGPKSADIVLSFAFGRPEIAVDTHVDTVAKRLGIASEKAGYEEVKKALTEMVSVADAPYVNMLFVRFGRDICRKQKPRCQICPISHKCRYYAEKFTAPAS